MKLKKSISMFLFLAMLSSSFALTSCNNSSSSEETTAAQQTTAPAQTEPVKTKASISMYKPSAEKEALKIENGTYLAQHFTANAPFMSFLITIPTWNSDDGDITISLYRFDSTIAKSIAGEALHTQIFEDVNDNSMVAFKSETDFEPGEYVFCMYDSEGTIGVWNYKSSESKSILNYAGSEITGEIQMNIIFTDKAADDKYFSQTKSDIDLTITVTTPKQPVIADDDILKVRDSMSDTWVATDGLGRTIATNTETGNVKDNKYVGLFYWTWHDSFSKITQAVNVTEFLSTHPETADIKNPVWKQLSGKSAFWNEPLFGFYSTTDRWVLRKHAEMLADAGVDVVIFDNTNGGTENTWKMGYLALLETFAQARADGVKTPQIAFMMEFGATENSVEQLVDVYKTVYRNGNYMDLWFYLDGKPLVVAYSSNLKRADKLQGEILNFFTFRSNQPTYNYKSYAATNSWGWLSVYPQNVYRTASGFKEIAVGVAQNWNGQGSAPMNGGSNIFGRTHTSKGNDTRENAVCYGANFAEQFEYALSQDPNFIFITGWNEWNAQLQENPDKKVNPWGENALVDQFNDEYSRDIEPSKGQLKDHYYYQMVSYIRQFKGTRAVPAASDAVTVDIKGDTSVWNSIGPNYIAYKNNVFARNWTGYNSVNYKNTTGRNDIIGAKVARDNDNIYFMVECNSDITPYTDNSWMHLFIDTGASAANWEGYEYVINKTKPSDTKAVLEKFTNGWTSEKVGEVEYSVSGTMLQIKVPKAMLGISGNIFTINFKWNDNMQKDGDIMDFYISGDTAPLGRFMYQYNAK